MPVKASDEIRTAVRKKLSKRTCMILWIEKMVDSVFHGTRVVHNSDAVHKFTAETHTEAASRICVCVRE
jgi:hypothetical protein